MIMKEQNNTTIKPLNQNRMEQTAVSWYAQQEIELTLEFLAKKISELDYGLRRLNLLNQAKEMEHKQHQETFNQSRLAKVFEKEIN